MHYSKVLKKYFKHIVIIITIVVNMFVLPLVFPLKISAIQVKATCTLLSDCSKCPTGIAYTCEKAGFCGKVSCCKITEIK